MHNPFSHKRKCVRFEAPQLEIEAGLTTLRLFLIDTDLRLGMEKSKKNGSQFTSVINSLEKQRGLEVNFAHTLFTGLVTFLEWGVWKRKASVGVKIGCRFSGSLTFSDEQYSMQRAIKTTRIGWANVKRHMHDVCCVPASTLHLQLHTSIYLVQSQ